ncbi:hypothetical protein [Hymenobacter sp. HDW8]|uniref:hypothetical protein n=1 Tax=Hymenobacter sp. HDW8 TaxID=2714932 RepID=UPI00140CA187|nr:hypothetical protein [Hymenobacter sp. HDW8]QIL74848.1 hypothetical protein G7064_02465 [Hymenobacter sp. HDW8]
MPPLPASPLPRDRSFDPWFVGSVLLQVLLLLIVFRSLIFNPGEYLIVTHYDGIKSYFSIASFLRQPLSDGMLVMGHNYPFGEYMYYTDCTPVLTQSLHVLVQAFPALEPYGLYLYDLFILGGLALSTLLLYRIMRPLGLPVWLLVLLSVALPWLGPQTMRLRVGHTSLSYTPAILFTIWVLQQLYYAWVQNRPVRKWFIILLGGIIVTSYFHFYYLGILGVLGGFFFLFWIVENALAGKPWFRLALYGGLTLGAALLITAGSLMLLDPRYHERPVSSSGYGVLEWKFQFGAFFRGYSFNQLRFPLERTADIPYESVAYLGGFVLYGLLVTLVLAALRRLPSVQLIDTDHGRFLRLFLLASIPMAFIALGETYDLDNGAYVFNNYLNPFFWLHKLTDRVTQFRALGRFVWPFWWAFVLGFSYYVARWWQHRTLRWVLVALSLLLVLDTRDAMRFYRTNTQLPNFLTANAPTLPMQQLTGWLDLKNYQAILPLPYFNSGSEEEGYRLTIDPDEVQNNNTYQLSMVTRLPLMSNKTARLPAHLAQKLYSVVSPGGPDPEVLALMDRRPVLVFLDTAYYNGQNNFYRETLATKPEKLAIFERSADFIREQHLQLLHRQGNWLLYAWYPKGR